VVALVGVFAALYGATLCPTIYWYDSAELIAAAETLGIPHPPGYPLYTLLGKVFTLLPLPAALAVNLFSTTSSLLTLGLAYFVNRELGASRFSASFAAALIGAGDSFWRHSTVAEAYTPGLAFLLAAVWLGLRAHRSGRSLPMFGAALIIGLGLGVHLSLATTGLLFVGFVLSSQSWIARGERSVGEWLGAETRRRAVRVLGALALALLGASIYLYLPFRARMDPAMNFGTPKELDSFLSVISGGTYKYWFGAPEGNWERLLRVGRILNLHMTGTGIALGGIGLWCLARTRGPALATSWALGVLGNVAYFFNYRVHDLEVFFLPAATLGCCAASVGLDWALTQLQATFWWLQSGRLQKVALTAGLAAKIASLYPDRNLSEDTAALAYGELLAKNLPHSAIIVNYTSPPEWKYDTVFRYYFQLVRKQRQDVLIYIFPPADFVRGLVAQGYQVFAYAEVPLLNEFTIVHESHLAPDLVRVTGMKPASPSPR
jgi:hypothetical protein